MGGFVLVVGPSGAGKDTLIGLAKAALLGNERFVFPKRLITRPASAWEDHETIGEAEFRRGVEAGAFTLSWRAHGLGYAVPTAARDAVEQGRVVVVNVSRMVIADARRRLPGVMVVEVTAPPDILAKRLAARDRGGEDVASRLARAGSIECSDPDLRIVNDGAPDRAAAPLTDFLQAIGKS